MHWVFLKIYDVNKLLYLLTNYFPDCRLLGHLPVTVSP